MLALTECHESRQGICAAAVGNPIVDWTALSPTGLDAVGSNDNENLLMSRTPDFKEDPLSVHDLLTLRTMYFTKPEKYFDPFASPSLFFRTPSSDLPREILPINFSNGNSEAEETLVEPAKKRRSHRKYPPTGSGLLLPHMRVEVGKHIALEDQGVEFVDLMKRSHEKASSEHEVAKTSCDLMKRDSPGLWGKGDMIEIGSWFAEVMGKP